MHFKLDPRYSDDWAMLAKLQPHMIDHYVVRGYSEKRARSAVMIICASWASGSEEVAIWAILDPLKHEWAGHVPCMVQEDMLIGKVLTLWQFECKIKGYIHGVLEEVYDWAAGLGARQVQIHTNISGYEKAWSPDDFAKVFGFKRHATLMVRDL